MKKIISIMLIIATMTCLFCSCKAKESKPVTEGVYTYVTFEDGTAKITKYNSEEEVIELNIPDELGGAMVTVIGKEAFAGVENITVINFPKYVKKIEENAFKGSSIRYAYLHKSSELEEIEAYAFADCANLIQVDISKNIENIPDYAFSGCTNLSVATFRGDPTIGRYAFDGCPKVKIFGYSDAKNVKSYAETYRYEFRELGKKKVEVQ